MQRQKNEGEKHPIRIAMRYSGVSAETIRVWERRHKALQPERTESGWRVYSDADIQRLTLLSRAVHNGRRISSIAQLSNEQLAQLNNEDETTDSRPRTRGRRQSTASVMEYFDASTDAINKLDLHGLTAALRQAEQSLGVIFLIEDLLGPLITHVRDECHRGNLSNGHRRLLLNVVAARLLMLAAAQENMGPEAVVCALEPDPGLEALKAAAAAGEYGWSTVYPGDETDPEDVASIARAMPAQAVIVGSDTTGDDGYAPNRFRALRKLLPQTPIVVQAPVGSGYVTVIEEIDAVHCTGLGQLRLELERIITGGA